MNITIEEERKKRNWDNLGSTQDAKSLKRWSLSNTRLSIVLKEFRELSKRVFRSLWAKSNCVFRKHQIREWTRNHERLKSKKINN